MSEETKVNTEKLLQWHQAFYAGLQIEFGEESHKLIFEREHSLSTKPMQIDVVIIKKLTDEVIHKNLGRIFRKYPRELVKHLTKVREMTIEKYEEGIYYIHNDMIPMQLIVTSELSEDVNLWLRNLTNDLDSNVSIEKLANEYEKHDKEELYKSVMNIIIRANNDKFKEAKDMCEALRELFADELEMSRNEGRSEGIRDVVINMLRKGMALIDICELTECSEEYVEEVRKSL